MASATEAKSMEDPAMTMPASNATSRLIAPFRLLAVDYRNLTESISKQSFRARLSGVHEDSGSAVSSGQ